MNWTAMLQEPLPRLLIQVMLIVLLSRLLGVVARRLGQPLVIAEITAGVMLGPSLFGVLAPHAQALVFAPDSLKVLGLVSQLGLVLFMFLVGLDLDPALLRGRAQASVLISHTSIALPFGLGALLGVFLYPTLAPAGVAQLPFCLFFGAALSITAFPVLARILTEQRLMQTRVGAISIACAAIDDVTAWCILAVVVAVTRAAGLNNALGTIALALAYIVLMLLVIRPLLARLLKNTSWELISQNKLAIIVLCLFCSSIITELIGIHALFGAFLFGVTLPKQGDLTRVLAEKMEELVLVALLPLFFAYSGVRTQLGLLATPSAWLICGLIIAAACMGKFGGSLAAARITGLSWRDSSAIGVLMNTRGLMELVVLNIGLDLGVIGPQLFTMMVVMALVTTFMTSPLVRLILRQSAGSVVQGAQALGEMHE